MEKVETIVACVWWNGPFRAGKYLSPGYTLEWVKRLRNMVQRNLKIPHWFVCLSNVEFKEDGIRRVPLQYPNQLRGWWAKMELFRAGLSSSKYRMLYLDLDTLIVGNLKPLIDFDTTMAICPGFGDPDRRDQGEVFGYNSSVMVFDYPMKEVWDKFMQGYDEHMKLYRGDQDFLKHNFPDLATFPREWIRKLGYYMNNRNGLKEFDDEVKVILSMPKKNVQAAHEYKRVRKIWQ